ncbi:TauD/TfdA family dioxygenase [Candidatus Entotheonella palauensis]|nr:TauD/TfdA family dioxygenase [Candidatus Entotheonella palauensis]
MSLEIIPTGAAIGAEIRGADLSQPTHAADFEALENAFNEHGVIFFRNQTLTPEHQLDFTRRLGDVLFNTFGDSHGLPECPGIVVISNVVQEGREIGVRRAGDAWHSDMCYTANPPRGTMLYAHEVPVQDGLTLGDTCFASAAAAYTALPAEMKQRIAGFEAVFNFAGRKRTVPITQAQIDAFPEVIHPVVRPHPITGCKCLYIMRNDCTGIVDLPDDEAQLLIAALADHIVRPEFIYRHQWHPGDLLLWDNCTVQHMAIQDYDLPLRRLMHRTTFAATQSA